MNRTIEVCIDTLVVVSLFELLLIEFNDRIGVSRTTDRIVRTA